MHIAHDTHELAHGLEALRELDGADALPWRSHPHPPGASCPRAPAAAAPARRCPCCEKRLARLNAGLCCYACQAAGREHELRDAAGRRPRGSLPHQEILARYQRGQSQADIARALGLSHSSVKGVVQTARMREAGLDPSSGRPRPLPREEILARYQGGERAAEIARALRVPYSSVKGFLRQARQGGALDERPVVAA